MVLPFTALYIVPMNGSLLMFGHTWATRTRNTEYQLQARSDWVSILLLIMLDSSIVSLFAFSHSSPRRLLYRLRHLRCYPPQYSKFCIMLLSTGLWTPDMTLGIATETTVAINNLNGYQLVSMPILFFMNERDMRGPNRNRNTFVPEPGLRFMFLYHYHGLCYGRPKRRFTTPSS